MKLKGFSKSCKKKFKIHIYRVLQRLSDTGYSQEKKILGRPKKMDTVQNSHRDVWFSLLKN